MTEKTEITARQHEYLQALEGGSKTTQDLMLSMGVNDRSIGRAMRNLRDKGLVKTSQARGARGNIRQYELTAPYNDLPVRITRNNAGHNNIVPAEEVFYVAILRNANMTGQELTRQHQKVFPNRTDGGVKNVVDKARARRLCL